MFSQNKKTNNATLIRYYTNDTIVINTIHLFRERAYEVQISDNVIRFLNDENKKERVDPPDVKFFDFVDPEGNKRRFVGLKYVNSLLDENQRIQYRFNFLYEQIFVGKVSYYRYYETQFNTLSTPIRVYIKDGKLYKHDPFDCSWKTFLKRLFEDCPELVEYINTSKTSSLNEEFLSLFQRYDDCM